MSEPIYLSKEIGVPLLKFIWKWKVVSTAGISLRFLSHMKFPTAPYDYLRKLREAHYIVSTSAGEQGRGYLWTLDRAGFEAIRPSLPELREVGYKAEYREHDWLVSAFHLGEWLVQSPAGVQTFSEQLLRRLEPEHYPAWVPKDRGHRPDGYWHRMDKGTIRTIALELELNRKKATAYQGVGSFYGESAQVGRVLWVVPALSDAVFIQNNLNKGPGSRSDIHSFVMLDSFLKDGWSGLITQGPGKGLSVESFLSKALGVSPEASATPTRIRGVTMALLNTRLKRIQSAPYGLGREGQFSRQTTANAIVSLAPHETRLNVKPEVSR
ncbi:hypothetical protein WDW37_20810 [Bdellovibrionota bacterium FG-1]